MRLQLVLAYDGRSYDGWATQPHGNTVQDHLEKAIGEVGKERVRVHASGRTDAGVHALGQVVHFDAPEGLTMNPFNWLPALNTKLPATIRVMGCEEVSGEFHARFSAKEKTYTYDLSLEPVLPPLRAGLAWHLPRQLDPATLEQALECVRGEHSFQAFAALRGNETSETSYVRELTRAELVALDGGYRLVFSGNGFMYKMVRLLTGSVVYAAQGRLRLDDLAALLDQPSDLPNGRAPFCAPADGLVLDHVCYA